MDQDLTAAYALIKEQGDQIVHMMKLMESQMAIREAHTTILQSVLPLVVDHKDFQTALKKVHQVRLAHHLRQDVSNTFIESYQKTLNSLLPASLRFAPGGTSGV